MTQRATTWLSGAALWLIGSAAAAQGTPPAEQPAATEAEAQAAGTTAKPQPTAAAAETGEVVVTAQRRSESLQRVPVAVSVLSGEALTKLAIVSERDLQANTPGLTVKAGQNENQLNYSLRGQTVDTYTSSLPAVLPYVNEVQVGGVGSTAFYDLQSIQVLKGPQGTLFGRNATGGAVLFTTARPTAATSGYGLIRYGRFNDLTVEGAVSGTLVEGKLLGRIAGLYRTRDGYQRNLFYNSKLGDLEREGVRLSLSATPSDAFTNDLVLDYLHDSGTNVSASIYNAVPVSANVPGNPFVASNVFFPTLGAVAAAQQARGPYVVDVDSLGDRRQTKWIVSNISTLDLGDDLKLKNVFGFVHTKFFEAGDLDGTRFGIDGRGTAATGAQGSVGAVKQFSDELQILGKAFDQRLEYVAGIYLASIRDHTHNNSFILAELGVPKQVNAGVTTSKSIAGYGQGTFDTGLAGFKITAGLRYTSEKVKFVRDDDDLYSPVAFPTFAPFYADGRFVAPQVDTFNKLSWTVGVQNQVTSDLLLYAASRRSFRSGGFNFHAPPTPGFADQSGGEYRPEVATDIELGLKYRGRAGDVPVRLNVALYNMWVKDVQRAYYGAIYGGLAGITVNVPKAKITGVEIDGNIQPASWLSVGGTLNYTNARFTDNQVTVLGTTGATTLANYDTYPDTPKWSGLLYADITVPMTERYNFVAHGDVYRQTSNFFSSTGRSLNPGTRIPAYTLANFRLGYEPSDGRGLGVSMLLKNAFDKTYYTGGIGFASLFALNIVVPGERRTWLAEVRYRF